MAAAGAGRQVRQTMRPDLSVIIVHWNTPQKLADGIRSLLDYEKKLVFEIIVIDNDSDDDIAPWLDEFRGNVLRIWRLRRNIGFGRACNWGAKQARSEMLLFLGPDTKCLEPNAVYHTLMTYRKLESPGAVSCQLLNEDGSLQKHYFNLPRADRLLGEWIWEISNHFPLIYHARKNRPLPEVQPVDMVIAHWLMVDKKKFWQAGGFPEEAFMFGDDIEINYRLKRRGYINYLYRGARVLHYGGLSTRARYGDWLAYVVQDSIARFCLRNYGPFFGALSIFTIIMRALVNLLLLWPLYLSRGRQDYLGEQIMILKHYLGHQWNRKLLASWIGR